MYSKIEGEADPIYVINYQVAVILVVRLPTGLMQKSAEHFAGRECEAQTIVTKVEMTLVFS